MDIIKFLKSNQKLIVGFLWLLLIASLVCTVIMLVVLIKKGDERKKYIVGKSGLSALIAGIIFLIISIVWNVFFEANSALEFENHPAIYLGLISIVFNISYLVNAKKYR